MKDYQIIYAGLGLAAAVPFTAAFAQYEAPTAEELAAEQIVPAPISDDAKKIVAGLNAFSLDIYKATLPAGENHFISPASISTAFGLAYGGAAGATADEIKNVLHYPFAGEEFAKANGELLATMALDAKGRTLSVGNALWVQDDFPLRAPYVAQMENYYGAGVQRVDYKTDPENALGQINQWVEGKTNNRIKNLLTPDDINKYTRSILVNTVFFKADWHSVFKEAATKTKPFKLATGKKVMTPLMTQQSDFRYLEKKDVQAISMPYRGRETEMIVFLPKSKRGLSKFEDSLTAETLKQWMDDLAGASFPEVIVTFPKFKLEVKSELSGKMQEMGMSEAFTDDADFSKMSPKALKISKVVHQTFLEVDEKGSEAAAATAIGMTMIVSATSGPEPKPKVFNADHPFFFLIRDRRTGAILFMGRYVEPKASVAQES